METFVINTKALRMTEDDFFNFCIQNRDLKIERDNKKQIYIMSPTGFETGNRNAEIIGQLRNWNLKYRLGYVFDSSTGFTLPNSAVRSPDTAWIEKSGVDKLSKKEREQFAPICPDFVIELKSKSDSLQTLQEKMQEWIDNGCRLGWLIDFENKKVYIYKQKKETQIINSFEQPISGEDVLPGFNLDLKEML